MMWKPYGVSNTGLSWPGASAATIRRAEQPALELRQVVAAAHPAEIAAGVLRLQIHRLALGELLEIGAAP